jgi:peptidoglycan-associated lipoprotein
MKKKFYFKIVVLLAAAVFLLAGCAKKETVIESSSQPQNEIKQGPVSQPKQEPLKTSPQIETKGEQKVVASQALYEPGDIHFDFDKYNLRTEDRKILSEHADWLLKNAGYNVRVEGNCDERGTEEYNMALGQRRADEARKYLVDRGIAQKRISTISYGKERPVDPGHDEEARAKNRRDHFVLSQ